VNSGVRWALEREEALRKAIAAGAKTSEIMRQFGVTKNAIVGKAARLGLKLNGRSNKGSKGKAEAQQKKREEQMQGGEQISQELGPIGLTFWKLPTRGGCRAPIGRTPETEEEEGQLLYCGQPTFGRSSWCKQHRARLTRKPGEKA
jgi:hypothetical protein